MKAATSREGAEPATSNNLIVQGMGGRMSELIETGPIDGIIK
ncbi:DUF2099 family protein [Methanosarcina siciliae]|nr:DUF2099 family protein [Methanosarcina siciliae]